MWQIYLTPWERGRNPMATPPIMIPLTEVEKAELVLAADQVLTAAGMLLLRRALFELDTLKGSNPTITEINKRMVERR
jgi:hypothetical protein